LVHRKQPDGDDNEPSKLGSKKKSVERKKSAEPKRSGAWNLDAEERFLERFDNLTEELREIRHEVSERLSTMSSVMEEWWNRECRQDEEAQRYREIYKRAGAAAGIDEVDVEMEVVAEGSGSSGVVAMEVVGVAEGSGSSAVAHETSAVPSAPAT
jgi:hypothetical protein